MNISTYIKRCLKYIISGQPQKNITAKIYNLSPSEKLKGKKIIVTGGGRGIGYALAKKFISEGAEVLIASRNEEHLKNVSKELHCKYLCLDIQNVESITAFINEADKILGGADCLVNNAGVSLHERTFYDVSIESWQTQISTNLQGPFFMTQAFTKLLKESGRSGNVLIMSSETGMMADIRPYAYTKAALNSMVEGLAYSLAKEGIRINAIAPGITASEMTKYRTDGNLFCEKNMLERVYLPEEVAEIACFLLSDASSCLSGQILVCNNGNTINSRVK